jgi:hypothetical protein
MGLQICSGGIERWNFYTFRMYLRVGTCVQFGCTCALERAYSSDLLARWNVRTVRIYLRVGTCVQFGCNCALERVYGYTCVLERMYISDVLARCNVSTVRMYFRVGTCVVRMYLRGGTCVLVGWNGRGSLCIREDRSGGIVRWWSGTWSGYFYCTSPTCIPPLCAHCRLTDPAAKQCPNILSLLLVSSI